MMNRMLIFLTLSLCLSCVSVKEYRKLEMELSAITTSKRALNKEIRALELSNKRLIDSLHEKRERAALLSTKIEKRLASKKIKVQLDVADLNTLSLRDQDLDSTYERHLRNNCSYRDTNSAKKIDWLSKEEKELIYWLNYARLNPQKFCTKYILPRYKTRLNNVYVATLIDYMLAMKPVPALIPDKKLYESATCHAVSMGKVGKIGHGRLDGCKSSFSEECCSYGLSNPIDIVIQLLIDEGITSLGHRYICLGTYSKVGVSIRPHHSYGTNAVLDFGYQNHW